MRIAIACEENTDGATSIQSRACAEAVGAMDSVITLSRDFLKMPAIWGELGRGSGSLHRERATVRTTWRCGCGPGAPRGIPAQSVASAVDRQYSPFIFNFEGRTIIPAESVYGAFEAKQSINAEQVNYAQKKIASVRRLHRTSLPIPHAGGTYPAKPPAHILGGLLTFESEWTPPLGQALTEALGKGVPDERLDLGCVAAHGMFGCDEKQCYTITPQGKPATVFLFELIARLQSTATVPMIDIRAYARWLAS
jgi:hypothetical protein